MGEYLTTVARLTHCSACLRAVEDGHAHACPRLGERPDVTATEAAALSRERS